MGVGNAQKEARAALGVTQQELADRLYISRSMVAQVETGDKRLPRDVAPKAVTELDNGFYALEVAAELTGGALPGSLNGEHVDLHRSSVRAKAQEELREALDALNKNSMINAPASMQADQRQSLQADMLQVADAIVALEHMLAAACRDYGLSWRGVWQAWTLKAKTRGYVR